MKYAGIVFLYLLLSCSNHNDKEYTSIGSFDKDSLETGLWKFKDKTGAIIEKGVFDKGIRLGKWRYYLRPIDSINWKLYSNTNNSIKTNVPDFLKVIEESDSIVVLKPIDTTQVFNLVIGNGFYTQTNSLEKYRIDLFQDLDSRDIRIKDSLNYYIKTKTGTLLYTYIFASDSNGINFQLFNLTRALGHKLIEVSLRCNIQYENRARVVFFSIIPNLFIEDKRFISLQELRENISTINP